ncbi:MAG: c-type cytochrome [Myxococcaceae bacterium]
MKRLLTAAVAVLVLSPAVVLADDAETWDKKCASCHGKDGKGKTKMGEKMGAKDYTDAKVQDAITDAQLEKGITEGLKEKKMPAFKDKLKPEEIQGLVKYMRSLKGK